ncbi:MAG: hypothetical protein ABI654_11050 [Betaproteobacteria bacterium]
MTDRGDKPLAGALFFGTFAIVFLGGACLMWPPDFFSTPFAEMTSGMLLRAAATPVLALVGLEFLGGFAIVTQSDP